MGSVENSSLICPITGELFADPVLLVGDGHTYERAAVEQWFAQGKRTSPLTGAELSDLTLVPNFALRRQVDDVRDSAGEQTYRPSHVGVGSAARDVPVAAKGKGKSLEMEIPVAQAVECDGEGPAELRKWVMQYEKPKVAGAHAHQKGAYGWFSGQGWDSKWPLHRAAMRGDVGEIRALLSERSATTSMRGGGRDPNEKMTDWFDSEPLGWAASFGELGAVIELILLGADPLRPMNKAGNTPLCDARRENHTHVVHFLEEYAGRARELGIAPPLPQPSFDEMNMGWVCCPLFGHPDFGKGAYHHPMGCCCVRMDRLKETSFAGDILCGLWAMPTFFWLYTLSCAYQPCGAVVSGVFPWFGDCPCTEHQVTREYVEFAPCCLTRGVAVDRRNAGLDNI